MAIVTLIIAILTLLVNAIGVVHQFAIDKKRAATTANSDGSVADKQ